MKRSVAVSALFGVLAFAGALSATSVLRLELADLIAGSDRIFDGKCIETRVGLDRRGTIATTYAFKVGRAIRNAKESELFELTMPGGELGDRGLAVAGIPKFKVGDEVLLFLTVETDRGIRLPVGLAQGVFHLARDPKTGAKLLTRSLEGLDMVDPRTGKKLPAAGAESRDYEAFVAELDKKVKGAK